MTLFLVTQRSFVFAGATDLAAGPGTTVLEPGGRFEGRFSAASNHLIDKLDAPPGVVPAASVWPVPETLTPITTEVGRTGFCRALTDAALGEKADRNYLVALAWFLSDGLTRFGAPSDARIGPFAYSQAEWMAGLAALAATPGAPRIGVEHLFDPTWQATMAAIRSGRAAKAFTASAGRAPLPIELFFYERLGDEGLALLQLDPSRPCGDAFATTLAFGSYRAEIAARTSGEIVATVREGLARGFAASRADIARLPPHLAFCGDDDAAPWLAVARSMTAKDAAFADFADRMGRETENVRRSAAFAAFCLGRCGVPEVQRTLPLGNTSGLPSTWTGWGTKAPDRAPAGSLVVARDESGQARVGLLAAILQGDTARVLLCRDDGPLSLDTVTIARDRIDALRWLDLLGPLRSSGSGGGGSGGDNPTLGSLSKRYESGRGGPGTVSTGHGDAGGVSYGTYQFASNTGSAAAFVAGLPPEFRARFAGTTPGDAAFSAVWIALAAEDAAGFGRLQHDHIKAQFYDVLAASLRKREDFDVDARSLALQNGCWSTAVQHGPGGAAGIVAPILDRLKSNGPPLTDLKAFDREALCALYAERGRRNGDGSLVYFSNNAPGVQEGVARRFENELADALRMLESG